MTEPTNDPRDDRAARRAEENRIHDAIERHHAAQREIRGWREDLWVIERFGYAGLQRPLRPSATESERRVWMAEHERRNRIDILVIVGMVVLFCVAAALMFSGNGDTDQPDFMNPQTLVQEVDPADGDVLPTSIPDGHGGTVTFGGTR